MIRVLLLQPPLVQLNTPYPATAYLTGFLRGLGTDVRQADCAIELVDRIFSHEGLTLIRSELQKKFRRTPASKQPQVIQFFLEHQDRYLSTIDPVVRFLRGTDPSLATRIANRNFLPEGSRFEALEQMEELASEGADPLEFAFGALGVQDRAKYLASLYIDDLADVVREGVDSRFQLSRYGEKLAASQTTFDPLAEALASAPTLLDQWLEEITLKLLEEHEPNLVGLSAPFPGNVYGALRIAKAIRKHRPETKIAFGGGYANTELRSLEEPRFFDFVDYVTLDDGERPLLCLIEHLEGKRPETQLSRTFVRKKSKVVFVSDTREHDIPFRDTGTPTYDGLPLGKYLSMVEMLNPMHRLWSDARWNKVTLAHGCYWKKCSFCDVSLDYIGRFEATPAALTVDRMQSLAVETGQTGYHFVDEAAPPARLKDLAQEVLRRGFNCSWWGNIRFEKTFTPELAELLSQAGCIAVTGGLEVASDRLLKLMNKGVTVAQVARVTKAFANAGVLVHAYLMYGFPTQTAQETVDSLEYVRQLFAAGCLHSAYWHRFSATIHSPVGKNPKAFGVEVKVPKPKRGQKLFAQNDLPFHDPAGTDHDALGEGLKRALYNFMHGIGLDEDVRVWFETAVPAPTVRADFIARALGMQTDFSAGESAEHRV